MTTINYVRWSADDDKKVEGSRQNFLNLKTIKDNNITGEIIYVEEKGVSGKVPIYDRPKLGPLLKKLPKDTKIIVSDLSRLGRLDYDLISFRDERITNLIISDKPTLTKDENRVMFVLEATMSDKYRRDLSEKQKQKCQEMQSSIAEKGFYITKSTNRKMTKLGVHNSMDKARAKATEALKQKAIYNLSKVQIHLNDAKNHSKSLLGMANYLNVRNIKTARGCSWSASTVQRALDRISTLH